MRLVSVLALLLAVGCAPDNDGDGVNENTDCDDNDATVSPNKDESCDGIDNDCDGEIDENVTDTYYLDSDGDGYGIEAVTTEACETPSGYAAVLGDCDDTDAAANPDADEVCDDIDNDCDDNIDENVTVSYYYDGDSDGVGDGAAVAGCADSPPVDNDGVGGYVRVNGDCDDDDPAVSPNATEICDGIDNDCEGDSDGDDDQAVDALTWYRDSDEDTYGDLKTTLVSCDQPDGYVENSDDCDDLSATNSPASDETCGDSADNDCDGEVDEEDAADAITWYGDSDGDGYGGATFSVVSCAQPTSYVDNGDDCDDLDGAVNPDATEICDSVDNDCDGDSDDDDLSVEYFDSDGEAILWYIDVDGDGYGSSRFTLELCDQPLNYVSSTLEVDCDDQDDEVSPGLVEVCDDDKDNDCDDTANECVLNGTLDTDEANYVIRGSEGSDGSDGASLEGASRDLGEHLSWSMAVGDFNDDGEDDLIVGAPGLNGDSDEDIGGAYIFYGPLDDSNMSAATDADAIFYGDEAEDLAGYAVTAVDLDGDGYDDAVISAYSRETTDTDTGATELTDAGVVYVVYGSATEMSGENDLEDDRDAVFVSGVDSGYFGCALANVGDINGDNREDLAVGGCEDGGRGTTYLIYGSSSRFTDDYYPDDEIADEEDGFASWIGSAEDDGNGSAIANIGDFDGDGKQDFAFGAPGYDGEDSSGSDLADSGAAFVIYGDATEAVGESDAISESTSGDSAGAYFFGQNDYDYAGSAVSAAGDLNDDGTDDFLVGAPGYSSDTNNSASGVAYIIYGPASGVSRSLGELPVGATSAIYGESQSDALGAGIANVGDVNDDDYDDIIVGAPGQEGNDGAAYLFYGPITAEISLDASEADAIFTGNTNGDGGFGYVLVGPGDMDNDGDADIIIGARADDNDGESDNVDVGAIYIFNGGGL